MEAPFRDLTAPMLEEVRRFSTDPGTVVNVIVPEVLVSHWWQFPLHNQNALFIKQLFLFEDRVVLTSVPMLVKDAVQQAGAQYRVFVGSTFYNALQEKDWNAFVHETIIFVVITVIVMVAEQQANPARQGQTPSPTPLAGQPVIRRGLATQAERNQPDQALAAKVFDEGDDIGRDIAEERNVRAADQQRAYDTEGEQHQAECGEQHSGPLAATQLGERLSVAARAPEVRLQHQPALGREGLGDRVERQPLLERAAVAKACQCLSPSCSCVR